MRIALIASSIALAFAQGAVANPTGGTVTGGSATISSSGSTVTVNSSTNNTIINWQSFSVGSGETTRFNQPSSSSTVLNRVVGPSTSSINGSLTSNGHVFLINPNGVVVAPGAQIDVGSLLVSTMSLSDASFLSGNLVFNGSGTVTVALGSVPFPFSSISTDGSLQFTGVSGTVTGTTTGSVSNGGLIATTSGQILPAQNIRPSATALNSGSTLGTVTVSGNMQISQTSPNVVTTIGGFTIGGNTNINIVPPSAAYAVLLRSATPNTASQVTGVLVGTNSAAKAGEVALRFEKREIPF